SWTAQDKRTKANTELQGIAGANAQIYKKVDLKAWKNPYIIVREDGVGLLDVTNNEEHVLKIEELPDALAKLPSTTWPYGRVVALADDRRPAANKTRIQNNKATVASMLHSAQVEIQWVPSS